MSIKKNKRTVDELKEIHYAIVKNDISQLKTAIKRFPYAINRQDELGFTPLHVACALGYFDAVKFLLSHKADPNIRDNKNRNAMHAAVFSQDELVIDLLLKYKAEIKVEAPFSDKEKMIREGSNDVINTENNNTSDTLEAPPNKDVVPTKLTLVSMLTSLQGLTPSTSTANNSMSEIHDNDGDRTQFFDSLENRQKSENENMLNTSIIVEREYIDFVRRKNLELLSKKLNHCQKLEERMKYVIEEFDKLNHDMNNEGKDIETLDTEESKHVINSLKNEIAKLVDKNRKLEYIVEKHLNNSTVSSPEVTRLDNINQDLFVHALSTLLHENFVIKNEVEKLKSGKYNNFTDTIDSCTSDVREHYDLSESDKSSSESFFHKFMRKKKKQR